MVRGRLKRAKASVSNYIASKKINEQFESKFIHDLLSYHPTQKSKGATCFRVSRGRQYGTRTLEFLGKDGSGDSISWVSCLRAKLGLKQRSESWTKRYRDAVWDGARQEFLEANSRRVSEGVYSATCMGCQKRVLKDSDNKTFEVDHHPRSFKSILEEYTRSGRPEEAWPEFHDRVATFQLLCVECHRAKSATG